ncbi:MAG: RNA polymerase sigma factor RpoH [Gammaproteobacteria bacterium]|nr:RNA polymerase sigma factor RpoH [Gammaproteobacteria bacterium]MDA7961167.1 RNA polymerase sigma factor RpoH [Gammaproteobacteria bacterium]MDA7972624.1 RNA polymerase sigma factor RpoH [Gammaproteobacteria bacterium]MDA7989568.1 RNA polymerase sigma factor RpoH [Gammaproteobacteria bacterium]MDA8010931.1 RNA polymerase sigma factor RpoH [Gammaproteobacteria bacterium]
MTQQAPIAIHLSAAENLGTYMQAVNAAPILSAKRERELALRYRRDNDLDAARELVMSHLRYVVKVARGFVGYGLPLPDLIQEGSIGLMKAVKRYDPNRDVRLVSFAVHWIKAEIYDYVLRNWRMVKVATTKAQRKLFFNLRKSRARLGWMKEDEVERMARDLRVEKSGVRQMEARLSGRDIAFDGHADQDDDEAFLAPANRLGDSRYDPAVVVDAAEQAGETRRQLSAALARLDARSRDIVARRWLGEDKPTLHQLADEYGVSAERIRQIEKRAMKSMRERISV